MSTVCVVPAAIVLESSRPCGCEHVCLRTCGPRSPVMLGVILLVMMASASPGSPDLLFSSSAAACATPAFLRDPRRTSRASPTNPEGDVIYAVLLGVPDGRWSEALNNSHRSCKALQQLVKAAFVSAGLATPGQDTCVPGMSSTSASGPTVIGIARMMSWSTTTISSSSGHDALAAAMKAALQLKHSRSKSIRFLYHTFLEVAYLDSPKEVPAMRPSRPQTANLADAMQAIGGSLITDSRTGARYSDPARLLQEWGCLSTGTIHLWAATHVMTSAMSRALVPFDMTAIVPRSCDQDPYSVRPPRRTLEELRKGADVAITGTVTGHDVVSPLEAVEPEPTTQYRTRCPVRLQRKYTMTHLVNGLRLVQNVTDQRHLNSVSVASVRYHHPRNFRRVIKNMGKAGHRDPSKDTLYKARVKFDVAAMIWHRRWSEAAGQINRYLVCDASPQKSQSYEVFVTCERVVKHGDLTGRSHLDMPAIRVMPRKLPCCCLGHGRAGVADKTMTQVHQTWLDYGPTPDHMARALGSVRQVLSDMGTEFQIANARVSLGDSSGQRPDTFLYPYALQVPGIKHILDWIIRDALADIDFWPNWQSSAKRLVQWFHGQAHRDLVVKHLASLGDACRRSVESVDVMTKSLRTATSSFADWRWSTLLICIRDLLRIEDAVRFVFPRLKDPAKQLAMPKPLAAELSVLAASPEFWDQARALKAILGHVMSFSGWVTGCACHDQELQWNDGHAPPPTKCPWKGCRAPQLAKQLLFVQAAIAADRDSLAQAAFVSVKLDLVHSAMSRVIARLELKLHWVHELPYLVWQADEAAVAQEMLAKYDAAKRDMSRAGCIHRVSEYLCGHEKGSLRLDMERHAAGHGMSKALASEILAYQLCILDDTTQEAPHRDVSRLVKRSNGSKPGWWFASLRLKDHLEVYDQLDEDQEADMCRYLHSWKSALQKDVALSRKLTPVKRSIEQVRAAIYRTDAVCLDGFQNLQDIVRFERYDAPCRRDAKQNLTHLHALKVEYLNLVIEDGFVYTLPATQATSFDTDGHGVQDSLVHPVVFECMSKDTLAKKHVKTDRLASIRSMMCPIVVQMYDSHNVREFPGTHHDVFPAGHGHEVDMLVIAPWSVIWKDLRRWSKNLTSSVPGCITICRPEVMVDHTWSSLQCNTWYPQGIHMAFTWLTHVIHMEYTWNTYGIHMGTGRTHGIHMATWQTPGIYTEYTRNTHGIHMATWRTHRIHMVTSQTHGIRMEYPWNTHGIPMEYSWNTHGMLMEYQWNTHGIPMEYLWNTHGIDIEYSWHTHGIHMEIILLEYTCNIHGIFMEYSWNNHGIHMTHGVSGRWRLPAPLP